MKLVIDNTEVNKISDSLKSMGVVLNTDLNESLRRKAYDLRDKAREILAGKINPSGYSTGNLSESIGVNETSSGRFSVGPDMRKAPYAEWVEFGHFMVSGWATKGNTKGSRWWEGYHYMEGAWSEVSKNLISQISANLKVVLQKYGVSKGGQIRHLGTGRFIKGSF